MGISASAAHGRGGGVRTPLGRRTPTGQRSVLGGAGMSQQRPLGGSVSDLQNRKNGSLLIRGPPVGSSSFLMESRARVNNSMMSAEMDRRQGNKLMQINRALDTEMDSLFETLVRKRGAVKVESLPLQRVGAVPGQLEPLDSSGPPQAAAPLDKLPTGGAGGFGACGVCMKDLRPGDIVRPMISCCGQSQHALCLRSFMQRGSAQCPGCMQPVLSQLELRELLENVR